MTQKSTSSFFLKKAVRHLYKCLLLTSFYLVLLTNHTSLSAQITGELKFKHYSIEDGLSQISVMAILQDSRGYLWFGTQDGLNRFDGYNYKIFRHNPQDSTSISSKFIWSMIEDRQGRIWLGTRDGGLNIFHPETETFTSYLNDPEDDSSISNNLVYSVLQDNQNRIWVGTEDGLNLFDPETESFKRFKQNPEDPLSLSNNIVKCIIQDHKQRIWIGTDGGLNLFDPDKGTFTHFKNDPLNNNTISSDFVWSVLQDQQQRIWVGTGGGGLNLFDPEKRSFTHFKGNQEKIKDGYSGTLTNNRVSAIIQDSNHRIWLATEDGLSILDTETKVFSQYKYNPVQPNSLGHKYIMSLFEDNQKRVWIGTAGGVNIFDPHAHLFSHFTYSPESQSLASSTHLSNKYVMSLYQDLQERIWVGTDGGGLNLFNSKTGYFTYFKHDPKNPKSISHNNVWNIFQDRQNRIWVGTNGGGLNLFNPETKTFIHYKHNPKNPKSLSNNYLRGIFQDAKDRIWVGAYGGGMSVLNPKTNLFTHYKHHEEDSSSLSSNLALSVLYDKQNRIWVGTNQGGLNLFNPKSETFTHYKHDPNNPISISGDIILSIFQDSQNRIWVGTTIGLNLLDVASGSFKSWLEEDGLSNDVIYGILEDEKGNLWLSTNNGINKFNPKTEKFTWYDEYDGLQSNEFNLGAFCKDKDNKMYFGGPNGFNIFHPDSIKENSSIPPVVVTDFLLFNESVGISDTTTRATPVLNSAPDYVDGITLDYNDYIFAFEFSALNYSQPEKNQFAYKLEPFNENWIQANATDRKATYTNIPHGSYIFRVKASNDDGYWNEEGTTVKLIINPPWWLTWWMKVIYVLLGLAVILGFVNRQQQKTKKKENEKKILEKTVAERTHQLEQQKEEITTQNYQLEQQAIKLQELDRIKSRFFSNISHEFRTPLTLIIGPAEKIIETSSDEQHKRNSKTILGNAQRLLRLINQLLDFSKIESSQMNLQTKAGDFSAFLQQILFSFELLAKKKNIEIEFLENNDNDFPYKSVIMYFDHDKLEKVFYNLLSNAFKFTSSGGAVSLIIERKTENIIVYVRDTGVGIEDSQLPHIFDRFYQVDASRTREQEGTGIGLSLAKELIELHDGSIYVKSEVSKGTEFKVNLPFNKVADDFKLSATELQVSSNEAIEKSILTNSETTVANKSNGENNAADNISVLVVEDNHDLREYICGELQSQYEVIEATNGKEGIVKAEENLPDIIISDIMMPLVDGYQLCNTLKQDEKTSHIPIILLTAKVSMESKIEGLEIGADDYLTKPFNSKELKLRIKNMLARQEKMRKKFSQQILEVEKPLEAKEITTSPVDAEFLNRANQIVEGHLDDTTFDVTKFCREIAMSRQTLHRKLKALSGQSTTEFIRSLRLKKAAQLLKQDNSRVDEAAWQTGFSDLAYFRKCFKKQFNYTPSEYKSQ